MPSVHKDMRRGSGAREMSAGEGVADADRLSRRGLLVGAPALALAGPLPAVSRNAANPSTAVGRVSWSLTRDTVVLNTDQFFDVKTQPQGEAQTRTADRGPFFDAYIRRLRARFAATTISPWLGWMQMGEAEGHLVWHTFGEKVFSVDELSAEYRERAGNLLERLATRPAL